MRDAATGLPHVAARRRGFLSLNPDPIKVVPAAQRDVWTKQPGWRCQHEDGRGRCTSRETLTRWNPETREAESFCAKHLPEERLSHMDSAATSVRCECGAVEVVAAPGVTMTKLRCSNCPPKTPTKPTLRLVRDGE